jgi:putative ABC transport system permease protein
MMLSLIGAGIGILLTFPVAHGFAASPAGAIFALFKVSQTTMFMQIACALVVGVIAALVPGWRSANIKIVDGLRHAG